MYAFILAIPTYCWEVVVLVPPFGSTCFWLMMIPEILLNFHKLTVHCFRNSSQSAAHPYIIRSCLPLIPSSFPSSNVFLILLHATTIFSLSGKKEQGYIIWADGKNDGYRNGAQEWKVTGRRQVKKNVAGAHNICMNVKVGEKHLVGLKTVDCGMKAAMVVND